MENFIIVVQFHIHVWFKLVFCNILNKSNISFNFNDSLQIINEKMGQNLEITYIQNRFYWATI